MWDRSLAIGSADGFFHWMGSLEVCPHALSATVAFLFVAPGADVAADDVIRLAQFEMTPHHTSPRMYRCRRVFTGEVFAFLSPICTRRTNGPL